MITKVIKVMDHPEYIRNPVLNLGRQGEYKVTRIKFDVTDYVNDYGEFECELLFEDPKGNVFPCAIFREDNFIVWEITEEITVYRGECNARLIWYDAEHKKKSQEFICKIADGGKDVSGDAPDPVQTWLDSVDERHLEFVEEGKALVTSAMAQVILAKESEENAKGFSDNSKSYADESKASLDELKRGIASGDFKGEKGDKGDKGDTSYIENPYDDTEVKRDISSLSGSIMNISQEKISKPTDAPTVGKVLKVKSVNEDSTFVCEWADAPEPDLTEYVKNTDIAQIGKLGICAPRSNAYGIAITTTGLMYVHSATTADIDAKTSAYKPITPSNLEYAVKSVGDDIYEPKKGDFELKGVLEDPNAKLLLDLSGCTELIIKGDAVPTGSAALVVSCNNGKADKLILASAFNTNRLHIYNCYVDSYFGVDNIISKYSSSSASTSLTMADNGTGYVILDGTKIANLNGLVIKNGQNLTSCSIEVWAR